MPILFGVTMFVSATLLFLVQPMVGKMILPMVGGTPAVWNTCMVFFQALLLAGYYYAHKNTSSLPFSRQSSLHMVVLILAIAAMAVGAALSAKHSPIPVIESLAPQGSEMPFFGVLVLLTFAIGVPFFVVSTTAPLLQKWFSETGHPAARDPYFLYAASNFGSLLALVAYPFVIEPNLRLVHQAWMWAIGFAVLAGLIWRCAQATKVATAGTVRKSSYVDDNSPPPSWATWLRWLVLAAVPSSLMLGVTTTITTDTVSMPLLWIVPLALYLITFIIVFAKTTPKFVHTFATLFTPVLLLLVVFMRVPNNVMSASQVALGLNGQLGLLFGTFFLVTLTCHGELARTRPSPKYLTGFYLTMSLGGMLGGTVNALVAPVVFTYITEYPLALIAACMVLPRISEIATGAVGAEDEKKGYSLLQTAIYCLVFFGVSKSLSGNYEWILGKIQGIGGVEAANEAVIAFGAFRFSAGVTTTILVFGVPCLIAYLMVDRPVRFGLCVAAIWLGTYVTHLKEQRTEKDDDRPYATRSFFGTMRVDSSGRYRYLLHGTTIHGKQFRNPGTITPPQRLWLYSMGFEYLANMDLPSPDREPLSYYHRTGPVGAMFRWFEERPRANTSVACIGLGTGSLSSYGKRGQKMTFFEIDWEVRRLVEEPKYFTYLSSAKRDGVDIEFLMGDARLTLEQNSDRKWGMMIVDAFSSDAIPTHLLTYQSVKLYLDRIDEDGLVALHISNRYLDLEPVVETICRELQKEVPGITVRVMSDGVGPGEEEFTGKSASHWVVVAKSPEAISSMLQTERLNASLDVGRTPLDSIAGATVLGQQFLQPWVGMATMRQQLRWTKLDRDDKVGLWTDDFTPIKNVLRKEYNPFR